MSDDTAHSSPEHHARTLLRGGRPLPPRLLYMGMQSLDALLFSLAYTIYGLYAVQAASLGPLELTLVGTIIVLLPALPLYGQALRHSNQEAHEASL